MSASILHNRIFLTFSKNAADSERDESYLVGKKDVVCKHWLNGLCKKGDKCNFLHVFDSSKMPICQFFLEGKKTKYLCVIHHVLMIIFHR